MPKLKETTDQGLEQAQKPVIKKTMRTRRMLSPIVKLRDQDDEESGEYYLSFNEDSAGGSRARKVPCTPEIYAAAKGRGGRSVNVPGPYDMVSNDSRSETEFVVGLDKAGRAVRCDVLRLRPALGNNVKIGDEPESTQTQMKITVLSACNSYYVSEAPRGMGAREVNRVLKALDNTETVQAGVELSGWVVEQVAGQVVTLNRIEQLQTGAPGSHQY